MRADALTSRSNRSTGSFALDEFDCTHQPYHACLADERMIDEFLAQCLLQVRTNIVAYPFDEALALDDSQIFDRDGTGCRMTRIGVSVRKFTGLVDDHISDAVAHQHTAQRQVARCDALLRTA